jgi:hypothetical protein
MDWRKGTRYISNMESWRRRKTKLKSYYEGFEAYVKPKSNKVFARYKFHKKVQSENEPFEQFITDLKLLVKDCGYADPDKMVTRDRIVIGCESTKLREKLIQEGSELQLEKAIEISQTYEMSQTQLKTMSEEDHSIQAVKIRREQTKPTKQRMPNTSRYNSQKTEKEECGKCGYKHYSTAAVCPVRSVQGSIILLKSVSQGVSHIVRWLSDMIVTRVIQA